eukprot:869643-Pleurochrysis_carterae.AAC.1
MLPKDAAYLLAPVSLDLVEGAQLQDHGQVWWTWYKAAQLACRTAHQFPCSAGRGTTRCVH